MSTIVAEGNTHAYDHKQEGNSKDIIGDIRNPRTIFLFKNPHPFAGLDYPTHLTYLFKADCRP